MSPQSQKHLATMYYRSGATIVAALIFSCAGCSQLPKFESAASSRKQFFAEDGRQDIPAPVFAEDEAPTQIASADGIRGLVKEPGPFQWEPDGQSAGDRRIESVTIGQGGYRTLILGSLAGDDPIAIDFTEKLAKHIHANSIILGGIVATVVRNTNPDGEATFRSENANGIYLNESFPPADDMSRDRLKQEPEIRYLLGILEDRHPQRVIHIRTTSRSVGIIAASNGARRVAKDAANWLGFEFLELPGRSSSGTLERLIADGESSEIITIAIPQGTNRSTVWEDYSDSILNLLLDEDYETRKLARQEKAREFADRRARNGSSEKPEDD